MADRERGMSEPALTRIDDGSEPCSCCGVPRTTADLDLVIDMEPANVRRLVSAMNRLGYVSRAPVDPVELADPDRRASWEKGMRAFTFQLPGHPLSDVDILIDSPLDYAQLSKHAERIDAGGLVLRIARIEDLIEMKQQAAREQDLADADALRRLLEDRSRG
jgi:hypothetical protein